MKFVILCAKNRILASLLDTSSKHNPKNKGNNTTQKKQQKGSITNTIVSVYCIILSTRQYSHFVLVFFALKKYDQTRICLTPRPLLLLDDKGHIHNLDQMRQNKFAGEHVSRVVRWLKLLLVRVSCGKTIHKPVHYIGWWCLVFLNAAFLDGNRIYSATTPERERKCDFPQFGCRA